MSIATNVPNGATTGNVVVTVSGLASNGVNFTIPTLSSISVSPLNVLLSVGATQQFTATGTYSDSSQGNVTSSAAWTSSDNTVATVSTAGIATGVAEGPATIQAAVGAITGSASLSGTPSKFRITGNLKIPRIDYTETTLQNGNVLIAGGSVVSGTSTGESELYNPVTGIFTPTGALSTPRFLHTATLLQNGNVLIIGGTSPTGSTTSAELYTPSTGSFTPAASLNKGRSLHTATLLQNGQVLVVGGSGDATAELYDPTANTFTYTAGNLNTVLNEQSATLLNDGTVLIAGGATNDGQASVATAEIYSPAAGTFAPTGNLNAGRTGHTASLLTTGKVLIATGYNIATGLPLTTAELYDPVAKAFTVTGSPANPRSYATATLLNSGQVLLVGGVPASQLDLAPAELYDPTSATFSIVGNLNIARDSHSAALLNDGTVLIAGGRDQYFYETGYFEDYVVPAEIYQSSGPPSPPDSLQITPAVANVMVGGTQHFAAIDNNGNPRTDVTWTVNNPSLASVTTDENDAGVLTGLATGPVTITATAETASAQEQVNILAAGSYSPGTVIWSAPPIPGFSPIQLVQAVPTASGPDLYSIQTSSDGTQSVVQALTSDGRQLWQTTLPVLNNNSVPDGGGGLLVEEYDTCTPGQTNPLTVVDLDPMYGQPALQIRAAGVQQGNGILYCYGNGDAPQIAIRADGAVIVSEPSNNGFPPLTIAQNGGTASYAIPTSTITTNGVTIYPQCCVGPPMVNVDGTIYVEYEVRNVVNDVITSDTLYLLQVDTSSSSSTVLSTTTQNEALLPGRIIPDGQGGILATWTISPSNPPVPQYPYQAVDVVGGVVGTPYNLPFSPTTVTFGQSPTLVLGENGVAFATNGVDTVNGPMVASFSVSSGAVNWTYGTAPQNTSSIIEATSGNGLVAKTTNQSGSDTVLNFSSGGGILDQPLGGLSHVDYYSNGQWMALTTSGFEAVFSDAIQSATSSSPHVGGNIPVFEIFEPFDPAPPTKLAVNLATRYQAIVGKTPAEFEPSALATWEAFKVQIKKPAVVVAFIGHSLTSPFLDNGVLRAVGLCFFNWECEERLAVPGDPEYCTTPGCFEGLTPNPKYPTMTVAYPVDPLTTQAKIIFIAACVMDANMQSWLGITSATLGRALVVPPSATDIDLDMGEYEWERIALHLNDVPGVTTLRTAVAAANADVVNAAPWYNEMNQVVPPQAWQVIGDSSIHF